MKEGYFVALAFVGLACVLRGVWGLSPDAAWILGGAVALAVGVKGALK